ncbi:MAG: sigma-70 family RNA polymerase sigma factor [Gammaproteobacteria bacterium]
MSDVPESQPVRSPDSAVVLASLDRQYRRVLMAYFRRRVNSSAEAEDLTQDVFVRLLLTVKTEPIGNAEALLFRIAVNLLRDRARRLRTRRAVEPLPSSEMADFAEVLAADLSPERVVIGERTLQEVDNILRGLGERTRAVFYLHRLERLKVREIANIYGVSVSAVEKQLARALRQLTLRLNGD